MTITESGVELAFKIMSTMIIPLAVYILNMDSTLMTTKTELISLQEQFREEKARTDNLYVRAQESEKQIREIKVMLDYMKSDLTEIKADIKKLLQNKDK